MFQDQNPDDALKFSVEKMGKTYRLARNFRLHEAQCSDGSDIVFVHPATLMLIQHLRDEFGAIKVNSWYRTPSYNSRVGTRNSKHMLGMAVDIVPMKMSLDQFIVEVKQLPIGGIGIYKSFVHLDTYGNGRRWDGK